VTLTNVVVLAAVLGIVDGFTGKKLLTVVVII
jgi:hypothetical protein